MRFPLLLRTFCWVVLAGVATIPVAAPAATADSRDKMAAADSEFVKIGFDQLASYPFTPPQYDPSVAPDAKPAGGEEQIPAAIKALNEKKAAITGYMVPVKIDKGLVTELLLMRNTLACCFGAVPNMNEWVVVKVPHGVQPLMDTPVVFFGKLKVGAIFENGYLTGLYQLEGERMEEAKAETPPAGK